MKAIVYTFFSSAHGKFSKINHVLGHKINLDKFKNTEILSGVFQTPQHQKSIIRIKLEKSQICGD